jgi:hypothetical protein
MIGFALQFPRITTELLAVGSASEIKKPQVANCLKRSKRLCSGSLCTTHAGGAFDNCCPLQVGGNLHNWVNTGKN